MCGICGLYLRNASPDPELLRRMNAQLSHRGPDGEGFYHDGPLALAMRRLAIIDLVTGDQPIFNEDRSVALVFNGEIYNYRALRHALIGHGHHFATQSDTEVLVHGYEQWGDALPRHLNGMFAFAIWDTRRRRLLVARDHLGIKPLYYALLPEGGLAFGSEIGALRPLAGWSRSLDPLALDWFLATRYIPAPRTIYAGLRKLPAAHILTIGADQPLQIERYWDVTFAADDTLDWQAARDALRSLLTDAVERQMIADVPLGAFLSGGIDSSIMVGLMAQASNTPVRTFSVTFPGWPGFDESPYARAVAERFGTSHTEIAAETDVAHDYPALAARLDEPFADPATLPTYLMSRETRRHVTVALTGEGADELFAGYGWYAWPQPLVMPAAAHLALRRLAQTTLAGRRGRHRVTARLAGDFATFYSESILSSVMQTSERIARYRPAWQQRLTDHAPRADIDPLLAVTQNRPWQSRIQELDLKTWLEGDPLVKADRTTMLASLEGRVPFLDVRLVELAARIPPEFMRQNGTSKALLRAAFADLLPEAVLKRPKHAFDVPIGDWLRGPLRAALDLATAEHSPLLQVLEPAPLRLMAEAHTRGQRNYARELWALLTLALWWQAHPDLSVEL